MSCWVLLTRCNEKSNEYDTSATVDSNGYYFNGRLPHKVAYMSLLMSFTGNLQTARATGSAPKLIGAAGHSTNDPTDH